jgi:hypothetical protein
MSEEEKDSNETKNEEDSKTKSSKEFRMITLEEWELLLGTLHLFGAEYEKNKGILEDIYKQLEDIRNEIRKV